MDTRVLRDAQVATLADKEGYGLLEKGALVFAGERLEWVGKERDLPQQYADAPKESLGGRLVTPGLIDCHTHLVFGGNRAREFEQRLQGVSYEDIAKAGGGILSTLRATRNASEAQLLESALARLDRLLAEGVTTIEVKSGYGLALEHERKMLRVARRLAEERPVHVVTSFLGAHAVPPEHKEAPEKYLHLVRDEMLPKLVAEGLVDAVDAFCERIAFSAEQVERLFQKARELGVPVKLHAEQLSHQGGASLAARFGALSADHLEHVVEEDIQAMAEAGTVAVLLPGAFYTLKETHHPPVPLLRWYGVPMALASDCNPGSSPLTSLLLTLNMGCTLFELTPAEALAGVTKHAATALGLADRGTLEAGKRADIAIWDVSSPAELAYRLGFNPVWRVYVGGQLTREVQA